MRSSYAHGSDLLRPIQLVVHCRANMAYVRQSRPDYGLGSGARIPHGYPQTCGDCQTRERESFIDNLVVQNDFIIEMIRSTGLASWEFEFPFPGSLASTFRFSDQLSLSSAVEQYGTYKTVKAEFWP